MLDKIVILHQFLICKELIFYFNTVNIGISSTFFDKITNYIILNESKPIYSIKTSGYIDCLVKCQSLYDQYCQIAKFDGDVDSKSSRQCHIYNARCLRKNIDLIENRTAVNSPNFYINRNFGLCYKLANYWNFNKNLNDSIGNADITSTSSGIIRFVQDRHGNNDSALHVLQQSFSLPNGVYINGEFTLAVWIKVISHSNYTRILSMFNNNDWTRNAIIFSLSGPSCIPYVTISDSEQNDLKLGSSIKLNLNQWQHLAFSVNKTHAMIFIDGEMTIIKNNTIMPANLIRTIVRLGKYLSLDDFQIDDLKLFNYSLNIDQLKSIMNI